MDGNLATVNISELWEITVYNLFATQSYLMVSEWFMFFAR